MFINKNDLSKSLSPLIIVGLFFCVTNKAYISAFPAIIMLLILIAIAIKALYFFIKDEDNWEKIRFLYLEYPVSIYCGLFYLISLISILNYFPGSLLNYNFYRYDGNFIISYAAFLFLPWFIYQNSIEKIFFRFIIFSMLINIPFFIYFLFHNYIYYHPLHSSTNAAGGFFSIVLAMAFGYFHSDRKKIIIIIIIIVLSLFLFFTTSRGSMLGLLAGIVAWYCTDKKILKWFPFLIIVLTIALQSILLIKFYPYYLEQTSLIDYQNERQKRYKDKKDENIYNRLIDNWPRGWDSFTRAPILGYGFGAVNDYPYPSRDKIRGFFNTNQNKEKIFSNAHAHHSYLHILAEQGFLGLLCLVLFWFQIFKFLKKNKDILWIRNGLLIGFWTIIFSSFTEHRITTPATLLPYSLLFLLYFGKVKYILLNKATSP
jgi:O-antigen ligase